MSCVTANTVDLSGKGCDILLLGCEGVGKTLLVKTLKEYCRSKGQSLIDSYETVATVGVELDELIYNKSKFVIREVGGSFVPVWPRYYRDCSMVIYAIDISNHTQVSASVIEFLNVLQADDLSGKPVLLIINKMDLPNKFSRPLLDGLLRTDDLVANSVTRSVEVIEMSLVDACNVEAVLQWMMRHKRSASTIKL
eukprot:GFYU01007301.1.p1 GENE.GFYU01007301.1~~GFYU01007301.1.p1  ORF type:complete len:195 (-),score=51.39 GFYU01007301.1:58-642(-)